MPITDSIRKFLKDRNLDAQYNRALNRTREYQQYSLFFYEIIFFVVIGGIFVNLISSSLYNIFFYNYNLDDYRIIILSFFILLILYFLYSLYSDKYLPKTPIDISISVSLYDLYNSLGYEKNEMINYIEKEGFSEDLFQSFIMQVKNDINGRHFLSNMFNMELITETNFANGKMITYAGSDRTIPFHMNIIAKPYADVIRTDRYTSIIFLLSYKIINPEHPLVDEFLFNLREYFFALSFEEFCDLLYNALYKLHET